MEGLKGLLMEGGSSRVEAVGQMMKSLGGALEAVYSGLATWMLSS
jgi:hypothetical protein